MTRQEKLAFIRHNVNRAQCCLKECRAQARRNRNTPWASYWHRRANAWRESVRWWQRQLKEV